MLNYIHSECTLLPQAQQSSVWQQQELEQPWLTRSSLLVQHRTKQYFISKLEVPTQVLAPATSFALLYQGFHWSFVAKNAVQMSFWFLGDSYFFSPNCKRKVCGLCGQTSRALSKAISPFMPFF